jgi:hypothetical protein
MLASLFDLAAAACGLATWIYPLSLIAFSWNQKPRSSLAAVGFTIHLVVVAACLSAAGVAFALLTFVFAQRADWAWLGLSAIAAFWVSGGALIYFGGRRSAPREGTDKS